MNRRKLTPWLVLILLTAGCIPKRFEWSPDGQRMTVIGPAGLRVCGLDGKLFPFTIKGVSRATWFPDSTRLLVARDIEVSTWDDILKYLKPDDAQAVVDAGNRARDAILNYDWNAPGANSWDKFLERTLQQDAQSDADTRLSKVLGGAVAIFLREHDDGGLRRKLPAERWTELGGFKQSVNAVTVYTIDPVQEVEGRTLMTSLNGICELRISPRGDAAAVAVLRDEPNEGTYCQLWAMATDASHVPVRLSDKTAWYPDWSTDGQEVVFVKPGSDQVAGTNLNVGSICYAPVFDKGHHWLDQPGETGTIASVVGDAFTRVRCAADGRIIFTSVAVDLPAANDEANRQAGLFALVPGSPLKVIRLPNVKPSGKIGDAPQFFELSPDGRRVSIPDQTGKVSVLDLASGEVTVVQPREFVKKKDSDRQLQTVPSWRSADELTFMNPGENDHPNVVLWSVSAGSGRNLNADWPAGTIEEPAGKP